MIVKEIIYFGQKAIVACDENCGKAWGVNSRPHAQLSENPDDYALLADGELDAAPIDPGTYEGGHAKPTCAAERMNKWCVRECERCEMTKPGHSDSIPTLHDFSKRLYNIPRSTNQTGGR